MNFVFFFNSILLGIGLAMDAFSVSLANGLNEPKMQRKRMCLIAGVFAFFQAIMPLIGWFLVHNLCKYFSKIQFFIPWIALILLCYIGIKMIIEGKNETSDEEESSTEPLPLSLLLCCTGSGEQLANADINVNVEKTKQKILFNTFIFSPPLTIPCKLYLLFAHCNFRRIRNNAPYMCLLFRERIL